MAEAPAQNLHQLERHAHAGQNGACAGVVHLGVGHGNALGHQIGRLVVVGDGKAHAGVHDGRRLFLAGDAAVHRDDEVRVQRAHTLERRGAQPVAFLEAQRDERRGMGTQGAQPPRQHRGGRYAV